MHDGHFEPAVWGKWHKEQLEEAKKRTEKRLVEGGGTCPSCGDNFPLKQGMTLVDSKIYHLFHVCLTYRKDLNRK